MPKWRGVHGSCGLITSQKIDIVCACKSYLYEGLSNFLIHRNEVPEFLLTTYSRSFPKSPSELRIQMVSNFQHTFCIDAVALES